MKTKFNFIDADWKRVKNHCRTTDNKDFSENDATSTFKRKLLISEHTPIRLLNFDWSWKGIPYWVSTEWCRHKFEKFISTQRDDRLKDNVLRGDKPQNSPVNFDGYANMQNLIDAFRKRLCYQATKEARDLAEDFKTTLYSSGYTDEADMLVPNCIYKWSCPEFRPCGFFEQFKEYCDGRDIDITNLSERYKAYREFCYERSNVSTIV